MRSSRRATVALKFAFLSTQVKVLWHIAEQIAGLHAVIQQAQLLACL